MIIYVKTYGPTKHAKQNFCLCVDDFGCYFFNKTDKQHLLQALQDKYNITIDLKGKNFCGLTLQSKYIHGHIYVSMLNFVKHTLTKLNYICGKKR